MKILIKEINHSRHGTTLTIKGVKSMYMHAAQADDINASPAFIY